jgi:aldehyde:ferredoxin oxidoreductase
LLKAGERIMNLERAFIVREGFGRKQDTFPRRMLTEHLKFEGVSEEGSIVKDLDAFLDRYYSVRGWTSNGAPTAEKINELGLGKIV